MPTCPQGALALLVCTLCPCLAGVALSTVGPIGTPLQEFRIRRETVSWGPSSWVPAHNMHPAEIHPFWHAGAMYVPCMSPVCPVYVPCMSRVCSLYGPCMAHVCPVYGPCMAHVWPMYVPCTMWSHVCLSHAAKGWGPEGRGRERDLRTQYHLTFSPSDSTVFPSSCSIFP